MSANPTRPATLAQTARHAGVSERTIRSYLAKGYFAAWKVPGKRGGLIFDLVEVDAAMRLLPGRQAIGSRAAYGARAVIRPLPSSSVVVVNVNERPGDPR